MAQAARAHSMHVPGLSRRAHSQFNRTLALLRTGIRPRGRPWLVLRAWETTTTLFPGMEDK
jgi:hypothetical protein